MTRINVIPPSSLCDKHLLAEYRELPRVFALARHCHDAPKQYTLGEGHVKFFYDKLGFLATRFFQIVDECHNRGFNIKYSSPNFRDCDINLWNGYTPTQEAINLNRIRIALRLLQSTRKGIKI